MPWQTSGSHDLPLAGPSLARVHTCSRTCMLTGTQQILQMCDWLSGLAHGQAPAPVATDPLVAVASHRDPKLALEGRDFIWNCLPLSLVSFLCLIFAMGRT